MPDKRGPNTYKGFESPKTTGWPKPIRKEVRHVYGAYRRKNPGEPSKIKARGSRIAWATARRKFPRLYAQHNRIERGTQQEMKEHPWAGRKTAAHIERDHERIKEKKIHTGNLQEAREKYISTPTFEGELRKTYPH
jgi:hypothetical protein